MYVIIQHVLFVFLFIYPITDTLVTVSRRIYTNLSALEPDNRHLHHLIYKKDFKNIYKSEKKKHALTTIGIFIFYAPFNSCQFFAAQTYVLMFVSFIFIMFYLLLYILLTPKDFS